MDGGLFGRQDPLGAGDATDMGAGELDADAATIAIGHFSAVPESRGSAPARRRSSSNAPRGRSRAHAHSPTPSAMPPGAALDMVGHISTEGLPMITTPSDIAALTEAAALEGNSPMDASMHTHTHAHAPSLSAAYAEAAAEGAAEPSEDASGVDVAALRTTSQAKNKWGFRGIRRDFNKKKRPWEAKTSITGKDRSLGYYTTMHAAAKAYDLATLRIRGRAAGPRLNVPLDPDVQAAIALVMEGRVEEVAVPAPAVNTLNALNIGHVRVSEELDGPEVTEGWTGIPDGDEAQGGDAAQEGAQDAGRGHVEGVAHVAAKRRRRSSVRKRGDVSGVGAAQPAHPADGMLSAELPVSATRDAFPDDDNHAVTSADVGAPVEMMQRAPANAPMTREDAAAALVSVAQRPPAESPTAADAGMPMHYTHAAALSVQPPLKRSRDAAEVVEPGSLSGFTQSSIPQHVRLQYAPTYQMMLTMQQGSSPNMPAAMLSHAPYLMPPFYPPHMEGYMPVHDHTHTHAHAHGVRGPHAVGQGHHVAVHSGPMLTSLSHSATAPSTTGGSSEGRE